MQEQSVQFQTLTFDLSTRGIATVVLNRPERGNAFDATMLDEFGGLLAEMAQMPAARVVVVRGAGRNFCAGADVGRSSSDGAPPPAGRTSLFDVLAALDSLPKPTIAVVHGASVGGGAAIAACCDVVIAAEAAFFSIPEVRIGMAPILLAPYLIRAMGQRSFRRYALSGERISAAAALRIGLAHEVCPAESIDTVLTEIADALLHAAPGAVGALKAALASLAPLPQGPVHEHNIHGSPEAIEGIASFREKRKPKWYPAAEPAE
jgi:methylglutaconyl-CoA hydratase